MRIPNQSPGVDRTVWAKIAPAKAGEAGVRPSQYNCSMRSLYCTNCASWGTDCDACTWCKLHCK